MKRPQLSLCLVLLLCHCTMLLAKPVTYLWDMSELYALSRQPETEEYRNLIKRADGIVRQKPVAVTDKKQTRSGNKHKYESLSVYRWPDPKNPDGPYIVRDGEFNPEYKAYDYPRLLKLKDNLVTCSKAFFLTGDTRYYDFFCRQLDVWFVNPDTRMTADFEYSQFIPGLNGGKGSPGGMVDAYNFNDVLESIRLVCAVRTVGSGRMKAVKGWFRDFADWMQTSDHGKRLLANYRNGHLLTYDVTLYDIFVFTGQKSARKAIFRDFPEKRVKAQIEADGRMPEALKRTKAFSYSVSTIRHFVDFLLLAKADGRTVPKESLERLQSAFDYIAPFADRREAFPYAEIGDWEAETEKLRKARERFEGY